MAKPDSKLRTLEHWITDRIMRLVLKVFMAMPYQRRVPAFGAFMRRFIGPLAGYRKRALKNLEMIRPDLDAAERARVADAVLDNLGRSLIENYSPKDLYAQTKDVAIQGAGVEAMKEAIAAKRPIVMFSGHYANYEVPRHVLHRAGYVVSCIYRPMSNPYFNEHYKGTLEAVSGPAFPKGRRGTLGFVRHLREVGPGAILIDVHDNSGVPINYLGQPAMTSLAAAEMALKLDALVLPIFVRRLDSGIDFEIDIETPVPHSDAATMTQAMTDRLGARVAALPDQWLWVHRRWKGCLPG